MPKITIARLGILFIFLSFLYALFFFISTRTREKDVSEEPPYKDYINEKVLLQSDAVIVQNLEEFSRETFLLLLDKKDMPFEGVQKVVDLPAGTSLTLTHAKHYYNGVSGVTTPYVFGTLVNPETGEELSFEYQWGGEVTSLLSDAPLRFTYEKAPWQKEALKELFSF